MPTTDWTPTTQDVATLLRARTRDASGAELGQFSTTTRPTAQQVTEVISRATQEVSGHIGADVAPQVRGIARSAVVYLCAYLIELSYYPEQVSDGRSGADQWERQYRAALAACERRGGSGAQVGAASLPTSPPWVSR